MYRSHKQRVNRSRKKVFIVFGFFACIFILILYFLFFQSFLRDEMSQKQDLQKSEALHAKEWIDTLRESMKERKAREEKEEEEEMKKQRQRMNELNKEKELRDKLDSATLHPVVNNTGKLYAEEYRFKPNEVNTDVLNPDEIDTSKKIEIFPVLLFACDRTSVKRAIDKILEYRPSAVQFPVIISQDCVNSKKGKATKDVLNEYGNSIQRQEFPAEEFKQNDIPKEHRFLRTYYKLSQHFKWGITKAFETKVGAHSVINSIIILEDDLEISVDFFQYFLAGYKLMKQDPTIWCVSAWNDNGQSSLIQHDSKMLHRTDFFPGLGWMLTRNLWEELEPKWPLGFWDDWMREPVNRKGRACIRPEMSRTIHFSETGTSNGEYDKYTSKVISNTEFVQWGKEDLSYLHKVNYDTPFLDKVYEECIPTTDEAIKSGNIAGQNKCFTRFYRDQGEFDNAATALNIMVGEKAGVPRTAYLGVVSIMHGNSRVYIAPQTRGVTTYST